MEFYVTTCHASRLSHVQHPYTVHLLWSDSLQGKFFCNRGNVIFGIMCHVRFLLCVYFFSKTAISGVTIVTSVVIVFQLREEFTAAKSVISVQGYVHALLHRWLNYEVVGLFKAFHMCWHLLVIVDFNLVKFLLPHLNGRVVKVDMSK